MGAEMRCRWLEVDWVDKGIEDLREKRDRVCQAMTKDERDRVAVQKELTALTEKYHKLEESIAKKKETVEEYDRTIRETEAAYMKVWPQPQNARALLLIESLRRRSWKAHRPCCTY